MLKVKDNVDIKELEKFGFKPKYSEDTGELVEYFYVNVDNFGFTKGIKVKKKTQKPNRLRIRFTFKKNKLGVPLVKESKVWKVDAENYYDIDFDILFDLIQAGLIEKVEAE